LTFHDLFIALRRRWRGATAIVMLVVVAAALLTLTAPRVYESRTTIYFAAADGSGQSTGNLYQMPEDEKITLARVARSPLVLGPVRETLGYDASVPVSMTAASGEGDASLFDFVVHSDSTAGEKTYRAYGTVVDRLAPLLPSSVSRKAVALAVEAAGLTGIRHPERIQGRF
jgi:capsular polysaccharide biosynthesis protein